MQKQDIYHFVGTTLKGRYHLEEFVDEGGMSIVYRARDLADKSIVAVKILAPRFLTRREQAEVYLKLFRQEAELAQKLKHPNIVSVYDSGVENNTAFIVMEWLEGRTLGEELTCNGRPSMARAADILNQICMALDAAHREKIIHLDLKPNNIFLIERGEYKDYVKVIDFGLSRIIQSTLGTTISRVVGTPYYIAPEVFTKKAGRLSDIYSLGVVTYEMLTGLMPFGTSHIYALINQHIVQEPPSARAVNREIPELIDELIRRAMSKSPTRRPQSAREFYEEFARALRSVKALPAEVKPFRPVVYTMSPPILQRLSKRINLLVGIIAFIVMAASVVYLISPFPDFVHVNLTRLHAVTIYFITSFIFFMVLSFSNKESFLKGFTDSIFLSAISPLIFAAIIIVVPLFLFVGTIGSIIETFANINKHK